jgi:SNF2 family DNA or RNA helicase
MYQITQFKWLPRDTANDTVFAAMQPAVRFATEDCIDLPPTTFSTRECELTTEQKKVYKDMMNNYFAAFKGGEINAVNEGVKLAKLLQICSGFAYAGDFGTIKLDSKHRLSLLEEIIDETDQKVIVFVPFKAGVDIVHKELTARGHSAELVYGDTSKKERDRIFNLFSNSKHPKVLVAHPGTMSHGLTLVSANTIVWYSPTNSYETYDQANARISRPGQKHHTHIINIESSPIEKRVFKRLLNKQKVQGTLLDLFKSES